MTEALDGFFLSQLGRQNGGFLYPLNPFTRWTELSLCGSFGNVPSSWGLLQLLRQPSRNPTWEPHGLPEPLPFQVFTPYLCLPHITICPKFHSAVQKVAVSLLSLLPHTTSHSDKCLERELAMCQAQSSLIPAHYDLWFSSLSSTAAPQHQTQFPYFLCLKKTRFSDLCSVPRIF